MCKVIDESGIKARGFLEDRIEHNIFQLQIY